jgi:hypothetical protein
MRWLLLTLLLTASLAAQQPPPPSETALVKQAIDGKVWGALIYATAGEALPLPKEVPSDLKDLNERLTKVLPDYSRYEFIGQQNQDILRQYESWVVPTKDIFLKLDSKGHSEDGGLKLALQLWQEKQILVKTDLVLQRSSPLIIAGPRWREGRLLFVLLLTRVE